MQNNASAAHDTAGLILAAGKGTRMKSALPKVLHSVAGRPMLSWVLRVLEDAGVTSACAVLSEERAGFEAFLAAHPELRVAVQKNRQGTGDAVAAAAWSFAGVKPAPYAAGHALQGAPIAARYVLIAAGDVPAVRAEQITGFLNAFRESGAALGVLGMQVPEPKGYGRLVVKGGQLEAIVEEKDADAATRAVDVCNTGIIAAETAALFSLLHELKPDNSQREYYLTDCVRHARSRGLKTMAHVADEWRDFAGVNDRSQLAEVESWLVKRRLRQLMLSGVTVHQPDSVYIEAEVEVGADSELAPGCRLYGKTVVGAGASIGAGSVLVDCKVSPGEKVPPLSVRTN